MLQRSYLFSFPHATDLAFFPPLVVLQEVQDLFHLEAYSA